MSNKKPATAAAVRDWANENGHPVGKRGRLNADAVKAFHKAHPRLRYVVGSDAEKPQVTVKVPGKDARGRNITRKVTITTAEARKVLGHPTNRRGRIPMDDLAKALAAQA